MGADGPTWPPEYETPRQVTPRATAVLCENPSEMTFEGTNSYVLRAPGSRTSVLVDPGPSGHDAHVAALVAAGGEVELILVTHRHPDHTGGIDELRAATGAPVRAALDEHSRGAAPLADGERIVAAGLELEIVATPGHTADSVSVVIRGEARSDGSADAQAAIDSIVLGDTILGRDSTVLDSTDGDLGDYLASLATLAALGAGVTGLPGHGPEVADTGALATGLAAHRRDRLEQIRAARAELGPEADARAITEYIYTDVSPFLLQVARQSTEVALRHLRALGE